MSDTKKNFLKALFSICIVFFSYKIFLSQTNVLKDRDFSSVELALVEKAKIATVLEAIGTAVSNESVDITANVTQIVEKVNFSDCEHVKKGQLLVQLNVEKKLKELQQLEINVKEQEREYKRLLNLKGRNVIAERDFDMQESKFLNAKAQIETLEAEIKDSTIFAPFDGFLGIRNVSVGTLISPGTVITTLDDIEKIKVDFSLPEKYALLIKSGEKIEAESIAIPNKIFEGTVSAVVPRLSSSSRNVTVRAVIENKDYLLKPGMMLVVKIRLNDRFVIQISEKCISNIGEKHFVYVLDHFLNPPFAVIKKTFIEIGERQNGLVEVSGLNEGDQIVFEGVNKLTDGDSVEVINFEKASTFSQESYFTKKFQKNIPQTNENLSTTRTTESNKNA